MLMSLDVSDIAIGFSADDISILHYSHMHDVINAHTLSPNTCNNNIEH